MRAAAACFVFLVGAACNDRTPRASIPADRTGRWEVDIDTFARQLTELHPSLFHRIPRSRFASEIASLRAEVPSLSDAEVVVGLMRVLALVGDSHTTLDLRSFGGFRQLPLRFESFADGVFVVGATEEHRETLGLRLARIGSVPTETAIEALREVIPYENDSWLRVSLGTLLSIPEVLQAQSLAADASRIHLELEDATGRTIETEVPAQPRQAFAFVEAGPPPDARPLYRQRPDENYWQVLLEPSRTLYVQYRRASDGGPETFSQFSTRIVEILDNEPVRALVIDLRNNSGGNSGLMEGLLTALERRPAWSSGQGLYAIIGPTTFSSALMNAFDLKVRTHAILVGEPTGGKPNHFGQVSSFILPASRIRVFHSTRFFQLSPNSDPPSLEPDVRVEIRSRDYLEGRDPVLEAVLGFIGS